MRDLFFKVFAIVYKLRYAFSHDIHFSGKMYAALFDVKPKNKIVISNEFSHSSLLINGERNSFLSEGIVQHTELRIIGNNNRIILKKNCELHLSHLLVRGSNAEIVIGEMTDVLGCYILCQGRDTFVHIGQDCLFSHDLEIWNSDTHTILDMDGSIVNHSRSIIIGNHVWFGKHVRILKGVTIGDNSVVGLGSVVSKDIESNTINAGIPCKKIKDGINWTRELVDYEN